MNNIFYSLIGVLVGSVISWLANSWLNKRKLRMDIEIKVVDQISEKIINLQESFSQLHSSTSTFLYIVTLYLNKDLSNENNYYQQIEKYDEEIYTGIEDIINKYEQFTVYLDIKEIVIKDTLNKVNSLDKAFWKYIIELSELTDVFSKEIYKSDLIDSIKKLLPQKESSEILKEFKSASEKVESAYNSTLSELQTLNEELLNKVYGRIFNRKRNRRIYEVSDGKLFAVEKIYSEEKAKQIYKNNRIKRNI